MKVLEIKNNLVKISYDVNDNLALSGFVIIEDENSPYVAQIMNLKTDTDYNFAIVKLLFTFNKEGILKNYNGTIPSLNAAISLLPASELLDIIPVESPLFLGELAQQQFNLKVDTSILDNNLLVCSNSIANTTLLLNNIISQINETKVIFDTDAQFDWEKKIIFGKDFKLPLNYDTINFIYENDLDDIDPVNKAVIQDIFLEVQEYIKTLPEGFIPFSTFLNVVDAQYKETKIPQLVLLKNKLLKYKELNIFAENMKDILSLGIHIEDNETVVVDISDVNSDIQKEVISYAYKVMNNINDDIYSFVKINNDNSDKKLLKTLIANTNIATIIICPHEYKYILELKENAQNVIAFTPLTVQHDFAGYNTFLNKLNNDEFIIYGVHTQNIPLIVTLKDVNDEENEEEEETNPFAFNDNAFLENQDSMKDDFSDDSFNDELELDEKENLVEETQNIQNENEAIEIKEDIEEVKEEPVVNDTELISADENIEIVENNYEEVDIQNILADEPDDITFIEDNSSSEENSEEPEIIYEQDNIVEEPQTEIEYNEPTSNEEMIERVSKDIDRAFYEKLPQEDEEITFETPEDELTEDDLNLIDNFSEQPIQLAGDSEDVQDLSETASDVIVEEDIEDDTPIVPIYEADDIENREVPELEPGDKVSTAKYGEGVVEKMIKYGNKMLCSIEFPNIGRRLLDPAMTEITKLS